MHMGCFERLYICRQETNGRLYLTRSKISTSSTKFVFFGRSENQDGRPGLWLAEKILTSPLKPLNAIQRNLNWLKVPTFSAKFVFRAGRKTKMAAPASDWLTFFTFPLKLLNRSRQNLTEIKIATSATRFVADRKTEMATLTLISGNAPTVTLNYIAVQQNKSYHWIINIYIYLN